MLMILKKLMVIFGCSGKFKVRVKVLSLLFLDKTKSETKLRANKIQNF